MSRKGEPWRFVEVRWIDSMSVQNWVGKGELPATADMTTRGWLVRESDKDIVVAGTHYESDGAPMFGEVIAIPKVALTGKIRELRMR